MIVLIGSFHPHNLCINYLAVSVHYLWEVHEVGGHGLMEGVGGVHDAGVVPLHGLVLGEARRLYHVTTHQGLRPA